MTIDEIVGQWRDVRQLLDVRCPTAVDEFASATAGDGSWPMEFFVRQLVALATEAQATSKLMSRKADLVAALARHAHDAAAHVNSLM